MKAIMRFLIKIFLCKIGYRVKYIGRENIRNLDKCIVCPNHSNTVEPSWIYADNKDMYIMAKAELFENFGVFPIRRGEKDIKSILHAINLFKNVEKRKLLIFPEGERVKKDVKMGEAKIGPAYIAAKAGVPIVPVYISKNVKKFSKVSIIYGKPIYVSDEVSKDKEKLKEFSDKMLDDIYEMGKQVQK